MKKIKQWLRKAREQKNVHSDDLERIIRRCMEKYRYLFPKYDCRKNGSRSVHHFNVPGVQPISLERPHGNREYIPRTYVAYILEGLDCLVNYIEMNSKGEFYDDYDNESRTTSYAEDDQSATKGKAR